MSETDGETLDGETYVERQAEVGDVKMALLLSAQKDAEYRKTWGLAPREEDL